MQIRVPTKYDLYLQSDEFDEIRQAVFTRDDHKCVVCGSAKNLRPHHLTYQNVGHEDLRDLITLCDSCHAIYHAIEKRSQYIQEYYEREKKLSEMAMQEYRQTAEQERKELQKRIWDEIIEEYAPKDYSKNGPLDMCDWNILDKVISDKCKKYDVEYCGFNKSKLQNYFFGQRYKLLLRCMQRNLSIDTVISKTRLSERFIRKWYKDAEKLEAMIQQSDFIFREDN